MTFPNVPNVPGVPPLPRDPGAAVAAAVQLLTRDVLGLPLFNNPPPWGIYKDGEPVVTADNVLGVEYKQDWAIADYPMEQGAFQSYDKVSNPFFARVRFSAGRSQQNREALLDSIDVIAGDLELYDVVTPEWVYTSVNVAQYDYRRLSDQGVGLLQVDVGLLQVRVTADADFTTTKAPSGETTKNTGTVQTKQPTAQQRSALSSIAESL